MADVTAPGRLPQGIDLFGPEGSSYEYGELVLKTNNKQIHVR